MLALRCSSREKSMHSLVSAAEHLPCECIFIRPEAARTARELQFAFHLAREAFREKSSISTKVSNETLLFLARETNFSSALKRIGAGDTRNFVLVCEKSAPLAKIKKELQLSHVSTLKLPEWGEKKGHYTETELAIEEMALARIRN